MPSAQKQETDEGVELAMGRTDFRSLLQAICTANINNLSLMHPRGKILFAEGEPARGVFILRTGRATASISSSEGRMVILRIAQGGDVLGLNSVLRNVCYNTTIKTIEPCRTDFIPRTALLDLVESNPPAARAISQILSRELADLTERARSLLLPQTASAKLAKFLLEWNEQTATNQSPQITRSLTHEQIAHMICASRETVTRLLTNLDKREIIRVSSGNIQICDRAALQRIAVS